jgi:hypothetical protein
MEYYGRQYFIYSTILPSSVIAALSGASVERLLPSRGLSVLQISHALRKFGLETLVYNYPPYQLGSFDRPAAYYDEGSDFNTLEVAAFVAPLYRRIYLDASRAYELVRTMISDDDIGFNKLCGNALNDAGNEVVLRFFLTSSRSYKDSVARNPRMDRRLKDLIVLTAMPKFIWVAELSNRELYLQQEAYGVMIVDATGSEHTDSTILIVYPGVLVATEDRRHSFYDVDFGAFSIYLNNLKGEWCQWQTRSGIR